MTDGQTDAQTDGRTSCDGITRAVHARRAVKSDPESTRGSGSPLKVNQSFPMPATFGRRPFPHSSIILFTEWQNDRLDPNPNFRINPYPDVCRMCSKMHYLVGISHFAKYGTKRPLIEKCWQCPKIPYSAMVKKMKTWSGIHTRIRICFPKKKEGLFA